MAKWLDYNRFTVVAPVAAVVIWLVAVGCSPTTPNPLNPDQQLSAAALETEFAVWQVRQKEIMLRFEAGRADIVQQQEKWNELQAGLMQLASGSVADLPGLMQLLLGGGLLGFLTDNVRKRGVIAGLKRNKTE